MGGLRQPAQAKQQQRLHDIMKAAEATTESTMAIYSTHSPMSWRTCHTRCVCCAMARRSCHPSASAAARPYPTPCMRPAGAAAGDLQALEGRFRRHVVSAAAISHSYLATLEELLTLRGVRSTAAALRVP